MQTVFDDIIGFVRNGFHAIIRQELIATGGIRRLGIVVKAMHPRIICHDLAIRHALDSAIIGRRKYRRNARIIKGVQATIKRRTHHDFFLRDACFMKRFDGVICRQMEAIGGIERSVMTCHFWRLQVIGHEVELIDQLANPLAFQIGDQHRISTHGKGKNARLAILCCSLIKSRPKIGKKQRKIRTIRFARSDPCYRRTGVFPVDINAHKTMLVQ